MEEAVAEGLVEERPGAAFEEDARIEAFRLQRRHVVDADAVDALQGEHAPRRAPPVDRRHAEIGVAGAIPRQPRGGRGRSEEHTSELQSLMRISYAVSCL